MKTAIEIPAVGSQPARDLDPDNRAQVASLIERTDALFRRAARYWERGNNSGDSKCLADMEAACDRARAKAEALLTPLGIKCSYPGLYPSFEVGGYTEYTTQNAVLSALGHPRNWLPTR